MLHGNMRRIEKRKCLEMWEDASVISSDGRSEQTQNSSPQCAEEGEKGREEEAKKR